MQTGALVLVVICALALANASPYRRHRAARDSDAQAMAVEGEVLVNGNLPTHPKSGYGISAGMGDWFTGGKHHRARHHRAAPAAAAADVRFQQTARAGAAAEAGAGVDELLPIRRNAHASAYSMPMARNDQPALTAANTPVAAALPREPTPMLEDGHGEEATHAPASVAAVARRAGHHAAAKHARHQRHARTVAGSAAYEMPTQFADTTTASKRATAAQDPDAFFHMQNVAATRDTGAKLGRPLFDTGAGAAQFDTIDKWNHALASHKHVNHLHKQLRAQLHGKPLPPPPARKAARAPNRHSLRFREQLKAQRKAAKRAAQEAAAEAERQAAAQAAEEEARAAAAAAAPPASPLDADAEEFVAFARALGEPIDPVKHRSRIAAAARAVAEDRLHHDARFMALRAKEQAAAARKRRAALVRAKREKTQRQALARELARVKAERVALAKAKKRVAAEQRRLARAARLKAAALKRARAKAQAAKAKADKAEAEHVVPPHLLGGAVPLPQAPAAPQPTAAAVAANPFLAHANAPPAAAAAAVVPPAPAPPATPAPAAAATAPVTPAPAAVPVPPPVPAAAPAAVATPTPVAAAPPAPALSAEELAMADYVGDKPVIFAPSADQALVPNPPPAPVADAANAPVEYIAPTPLSQLDDVGGAAAEVSEDSAEANADNNDDVTALAIAADDAPLPAAAVAAHDTGVTTHGSVDDLMEQQNAPVEGALLQTASAAATGAGAGAAVGKWKGADKAAAVAGVHGAAGAMNPVLTCILANCSVPYLTCLSSMECSAVFDCLQTTGAPIASCAKYHARMGERDKRMFGDLSDCEQQHMCFGGLTEPPTDAHTQPTTPPAGPIATNPSRPPAPGRPVKPPTGKPPGPAKCEVVCARKCREDQACLHACTADCFQKRYVVQL